MDSEEAFGFWETLSGNLPKEAVDAPSLQAFKARMDVALGSLVCWVVTLHIAGGWNWMSIVVLFNPGHSMDPRDSAAPTWHSPQYCWDISVWVEAEQGRAAWKN